MNVFAVYLCGCTDCFISAVFLDEAYANTWAKVASKNPEGYLIKEMSPEQLATELNGQDYN